MKRWWRPAVAVALVALAMPALADEVIIKKITPDKPPVTPTQPDQPTKPVGPTTPAEPPKTWTPPVVLGGDWVIQQAFRQANVTDEQKEKLKGILDELAAEAKGDTAKWGELSSKLNAAYKAARDAGKTDFVNDPDIKAAREELTRHRTEAAQGQEKRWERLLAASEGVLSAEQIGAVKDLFERYSTNVTVKNRPLARDWIKSSYPGVTLSADQQEQLVAKLAPIQDKFGQQFADLQKAQGERMQALLKEDPKTGWQKAQAEFAPKFEEVRSALAKAMNETIEAALSDEQKQQVTAGRQEAWAKSVQTWVDATAKSFEPLKLSDEQKAKIKELAAAAGQAMLKTEANDFAGRNDLAAKLREDIKKLLTDEQKKLVR